MSEKAESITAKDGTGLLNSKNTTMDIPIKEMMRALIACTCRD